MSSNKKITMITTQFLPEDSLPEVTKFTFSGVELERNHCRFLSFSHQTQEGSIQYLLKCSKHEIQLTQKGDISSQMMFIPNKTTHCNYQTPMGTLSFTIYTRSVVIEATQLNIEYELYQQDQLVSTQQICITIT